MTDGRCSRDDCDRSGKITRGMCQRHYGMWLRATPIEERGKPPRSDRSFDEFVVKVHARGCWVWEGPRNRRGYGLWSGGGYKGLAHRYSLARHESPPSNDSCVLHHCDNPPCVNPDHLYWGGHRENAIDAVSRGLMVNGNAQKTHCQNGHALAGANLITVRRGNGRTNRRCRICDNARKAASARRSRARRGAA